MGLAVDAVVFDVGETLVNEDRAWSSWADWIGVPRGTFFAAMGAVIERRRDHLEVFQVLRPGFDFDAQRRAKEEAGKGWTLEAEDLYGDAAECLRQLRRRGLRLGIAGNQPAGVEKALLELDLPVDFVASSERWRVAKPAGGFFAKVIEAAGAPAGAIAYVGDRLDFDVLPAQAAGMKTVFIRRGPWGCVQAAWPEAAQADAVVDSLAEVPGLL
jgi:FMN phosphatase YigB (HAD superfamily)